MLYLWSIYLVEGIGDEVLYGIGVFLGIFVLLVVYIMNRGRWDIYVFIINLL